MRNPFHYFNSSPEVIRLVVMMYIRYPLSLRQVEDILFERGIDICHELACKFPINVTVPSRVKCLAIQALFFLVRRWPSGIPSARAFCLRAPGVRLSALEMVFTRVLSFECFLSSLTSARVQSRRTTRFLLAIVLAITFPSFARGL